MLVIGPVITPEETYPIVPNPMVVLVTASFKEIVLTYPEVPKPATVLGKKYCAELGYKILIASAVEKSSPDRVLI